VLELRQKALQCLAYMALHPTAAQHMWAAVITRPPCERAARAAAHARVVKLVQLYWSTD